MAAGHQGYVSAQAATLDGVPQVLIFSDDGLFAVDPATGRPYGVVTPGAVVKIGVSKQ